MNYKQKLYDSYVTDHTEHLYGKNSLEKIANHFTSWNYYFGEFLPEQLDAKILDIGCGDGEFVYWFHIMGYQLARGIDISEEQIQAGRSMGIQNIERAELAAFLGDIYEEYDLIIARDVIEHFTKAEVYDLTRLVLKSLKPTGKFLVQVPNGEGMFFGSIFYSDFTHEVAFTGKSMRQLMLNTGFYSVSIKPVGPPKVGVIGSLRWLIWKMVTAVLNGLKIIETGRVDGIFTQNIIGVALKSGGANN